MKSTMANIFFGLLAAAFALFALWMLYGSISTLMKSWRATSWPTASAEVQSVALEHHSHSRGRTYQVVVTYTYVVDGRTYTGDTIAFGYGGSSAQSEHEQLFQKLGTARLVKVHYNPRQAAESCIVDGVSKSQFTPLAFSLMLLVFVTGFALMWWLGSRSEERLLQRIEVMETRELPR